MVEKPKTSVVDIHLKKGIRPQYDIYIGRRVTRTHDFQKSSKWCNPKQLNNNLKLYEDHIRACINLWPEKYNLDELKGKKLGCWCITTDKLEPLICHGQILMKLIKEREVND